MTAAVRAMHRGLIHVTHHHDDWTWFRAGLAILMITASVILNLGVFTLLVLAHITLDIVKYKSRHALPWSWTILEALRESLIDIFFLALGLLLGLGFHHALAIGGLGSLARVELMLLNVLIRILPRVHIAETIFKVLVHWRHHFEEQFIPCSALRKSERMFLIATILIVVTIATIPMTTDYTWHETSMLLLAEITPRWEFGILKTISHL